MFYIRKEAGNYWQVCIADGTIGWLSSAFCMVNLPDVLPSILYENPNAVSAAFVTCGQPLDGITGYKLYDALYENPRLGRSEFVMPLNYSMAKKVGIAQQSALAQGDCIKMIESYRPYDVQVKVREALYAKERSNREIKTALNAGSWNTGWFIASTLSNHQRGVAMDVTLVRAEQMEQQQLVGCPFVRVTGNDYEMPSVIHELSSAAACFSGPVTSNSKTAWKKAEPAPGMTEGAFRLQKYCTDADLTPLASEWWHFNDLDAQNRVSNTSGRGGFRVEGCLSWKMFDA
ncbi:MAG: D-ala-D-ala dipeptidase [Faecalibacterium sp.]